MSKKVKQTSTSTSTSTPTNPEWVTQGVQGLQGRINGLLDTDASTLVPGASQLQQQMFGQAGDLGAGTRAAQGLLDADPMGAASATSRGLLDIDLDGYQNPWQRDVVDTTLSGFDEQAGMRRAELAGAQGRGQKFSGSGSAIERMLFERGSGMDRAAQEAQLRSAGFDRATGLATGDLNREASTSQFNAGAANQMAIAQRSADLQAAGLLGSSERADLGLLSDLGGQQREIEREELGADTELLKLIAALNSSQPYGLFQGNTQTGSGTNITKTSDPMGTAAGLLGGLGSLASGAGAIGAAGGLGTIFSDKRLKEGVQTVGKDASGRRVVSYRYRGEPKDVTRIGHIAQEVQRSDPHAIRKVGKHLAIDYGLLGDVA